MNLARNWFAARSWADDSDTLRLRARDLARSIHFFATVLGFEVLRNERLGGARCVTMSPRTGRTVTLHDWRCAEHAEASKGNRKVVVADLDQVRARAWDFGTRVARRGDGADRILQPARSRSLWIYDPDGHALELVEAGTPISTG